MSYKNAFVLSMLVILLSSYAGLAETVIYDNVTTSNLKCVQIDEITNIKFLDEYKYRILLNGSYLGDYGKWDCIFVNDGANLQIIVPSNIKQNLNPNWLLSTAGVLFYGFIQYGWYVVLALALAYWILRRR